MTMPTSSAVTLMLSFGTFHQTLRGNGFQGAAPCSLEESTWYSLLGGELV